MSTVAQRMKLYRERLKLNLAVMPLEIDTDAWAKILVRTGLLKSNLVDDRMELFAAMKKFIDLIEVEHEGK